MYHEDQVYSPSLELSISVLFKSHSSHICHWKVAEYSNSSKIFNNILRYVLKLEASLKYKTASFYQGEINTVACKCKADCFDHFWVLEG